MQILTSALFVPPLLLAVSLASPFDDESVSMSEAATPNAQSCVQWSQFDSWLDQKGIGFMRDPANPDFHTRRHQSRLADRILRIGMGFPDEQGRGPYPRDYYSTLFSTLVFMFGADLQFVAEANGYSSHTELLGEQGLRALDGIVDFGTLAASTESENYCAKVHPVTAGEHEGEFLVVARDKSTGRIIGLAVAATLDEAKALAADMVEDGQEERDKAEGEGVVAFPDGCGDLRMPPGFGC